MFFFFLSVVVGYYINKLKKNFILKILRTIVVVFHLCIYAFHFLIK